MGIFADMWADTGDRNDRIRAIADELDAMTDEELAQWQKENLSPLDQYAFRDTKDHDPVEFERLVRKHSPETAWIFDASDDELYEYLTKG